MSKPKTVRVQTQDEYLSEMIGGALTLIIVGVLTYRWLFGG